MRNKNLGGRPPLAEDKKRNIKISFYLNEHEYNKYISLKNILSEHSPTLSINSFFRLVINKYDDGLLEYLDLEFKHELRTHLKTLRVYNKQFK